MRCRMDRDVNAAVNIMKEGKESLQNVHDSTIKVRNRTNKNQARER